MIAYKFLASGAKGAFSGYAWPAPRDGQPGAWVEVDGPLDLCRRGVHLCRLRDLAYWLHDELWEVESEGDAAEGIDCIVVRCARLVRRVDSWSEGGAARFAEACIEHAAAIAGSATDPKSREFLEDAKLGASGGYFAVGAFSAALAAAKVSPISEYEQAYRRERVWQSEWIARHLIAM